MLQNQTTEEKESIVPLRTFFFNAVLKIQGVSTFMSLRNAMFIFQNEKELKKQKNISESVDKLKNKIFGYFCISPSTLLLTLLIQNKFSHILSRTVFHRALLFTLWYTGSHYLISTLIEKKMKEKEYQQLFRQLIIKYNQSYLRYLYVNETYYLIPLLNQLAHSKISQQQVSGVQPILIGFKKEDQEIRKKNLPSYKQNK